MPSGYSEAMRVFKPPFSILRSHGYLYVIFSDDSYLQGHTFSKCEDNVNTAWRVAVSWFYNSPRKISPGPYTGN